MNLRGKDGRDDLAREYVLLGRVWERRPGSSHFPSTARLHIRDGGVHHFPDLAAKGDSKGMVLEVHFVVK